MQRWFYTGFEPHTVRARVRIRVLRTPSRRHTIANRRIVVPPRPRGFGIPVHVMRPAMIRPMGASCRQGTRAASPCVFLRVRVRVRIRIIVRLSRREEGIIYQVRVPTQSCRAEAGVHSVCKVDSNAGGDLVIQSGSGLGCRWG